MYKYQVKIRGEKDPIILEGERGKRLKESFDNETIKSMGWVNFGGEASYQASQIDGIKAIWIPDEQKEVSYTDAQFQKVHDDYTALVKEFGRKKAMWKWFESKGAMKIQNLEKEEMLIIPSLYKTYDDLWRKYNAWQAKREFVERERMKHYAEIELSRK